MAKPSKLLFDKKIMMRTWENSENNLGIRSQKPEKIFSPRKHHVKKKQKCNHDENYFECNFESHQSHNFLLNTINSFFLWLKKGMEIVVGSLGYNLGPNIIA